MDTNKFFGKNQTLEVKNVNNVWIIMNYILSFFKVNLFWIWMLNELRHYFENVFKLNLAIEHKINDVFSKQDLIMK